MSDIAYDTDGDGWTDTAVADTDGDGYVDTAVVEVGPGPFQA